MKWRAFSAIFASLVAAACGVEGSADSPDVPPPIAEDLVEGDPAAYTSESAGGAIVLPRQAPVLGRSITSWSESWYRWHFAVPATESPILHLDRDCATGQNEGVYFVPTYDGASTFERTCRVPFPKPVLIPAWVVINDYPCPDPAFRPAPGQSLEAFLRGGAVAYNDGVTNLAITIDGEAVNAQDHRHTTRLFHFTGHASLVGQIPDSCLLGRTPQPAVADGFWIMLLLGPGNHVVRVTGSSPEATPFDATYRLKVDR